MKLLTRLPLLALLAVMCFSCSTDNLSKNADALNQNLIVPQTKTIEIQILELLNNHRLSIGLNPLENMDIIKTNAGAKVVSENVAYGYTKAETVVNAWLKSDGHRENIEGDFTDFDVSAEQNGDGDWYYTNIFIKR